MGSGPSAAPSAATPLPRPRSARAGPGPRRRPPRAAALLRCGPAALSPRLCHRLRRDAPGRPRPGLLAAPARHAPRGLARGLRGLPLPAAPPLRALARALLTGTERVRSRTRPATAPRSRSTGAGRLRAACPPARPLARGRAAAPLPPFWPTNHTAPARAALRH